jgi:hypothetical protein
MTRAMGDDAFEEGRQARLEGRSLDSNPYFGGSKSDAANQLKWDLGWKVLDEATNRLLPASAD